MVIPLLLSQNHEFCSLFAAQWQISAGPCVSCQRKKSAAIFLRWKFSTLLSANAAALCCICIILSHLDKNRCRTETSAMCISLPYNTLLQQRKCFETLKDFKWGMQKKEVYTGNTLLSLQWPFVRASLFLLYTTQLVSTAVLAELLCMESWWSLRCLALVIGYSSVV